MFLWLLHRNKRIRIQPVGLPLVLFSILYTDAELKTKTGAVNPSWNAETADGVANSMGLVQHNYIVCGLPLVFLFDFVNRCGTQDQHGRGAFKGALCA